MKKNFYILFLTLFFLSIQQPAKAIGDGFVQNKDQMTDMNGNSISDVFYKMEKPGLNIWITATGITYQFLTFDKKYISVEGDTLDHFVEGSEKLKLMNWKSVNLILENANISKENVIHGQQLNNGNRIHYNKSYPNGVSGVATYDSITFTNIYEGIDWVIYTHNGKMKYDFVINPGATPDDLSLVYQGAGFFDFKYNALAFHNSMGEVNEGELFCFQDKKTVKARYVQEVNKNVFPLAVGSSFDPHAVSKENKVFSSRIKIEVESYDTSKVLILDPIIEWGTLYGGNGNDGVQSVEVDSDNNIYQAGYTTSTNFPLVDVGSFFSGTNNAGISDVFIHKFSPDGQLLWSTYYGAGGNSNVANDLCVDNNNNIWIIGNTDDVNFPLQNAGNYFQATYGGGNKDAFLLKFDANGNRLYSTFIGGLSTDEGNSIAADKFGNVWLTGRSSSSDFPTQSNGTFFQPNLATTYDAFIMKFDQNTNLLWSTYFGGHSADVGTDITTDLFGNIWLTGETWSTDFPLLDVGAFFQPTSAGSIDMFISKFSNSGVLEWSTYYGGTDKDIGVTIKTDFLGNAWVSAFTTSNDFPTQDIGSFFQATNGGGFGDFGLIKFDDSGNRLYATYLGGSGKEENPSNNSLAIDSCNNLFCTMILKSAQLPVISDSCSFNDSYFSSSQPPSTLGPRKCYVAQFTPSAEMTWSTYFGGELHEFSPSITIDRNNDVLLAGEFMSYDSISVQSLPLQNNGGNSFFDDSPNGADDSFIFKFVPSPISPAVTTSNSSSCTNCNGSVVVEVDCGYPPFSFVWSDGTQHLNVMSSEDSLDNICSGDYWVEVTSNCNVVDTIWFTVGGINCDCNNPPILELDSVKNDVCNLSNGFIGVSVSDTTGTPGFDYYLNNVQVDSTMDSLQEGIYEVVIVDSLGCSDTLNYEIVNTELIELDFNFSDACTNDTVFFTSDIVLDSGNLTSIHWDFDNGISSSITDTAIVYSTSGTYQVELTVQNDLGCVKDTIKSITIHDRPVVTIEADTACLDAQTNFSANVLNGNSNQLQYTWDFNDGNQGFEENVAHTYQDIGDFQVELSVENNHGCLHTDTLLVHIDSLPFVNFSYTVTDYCGYSNVQFTDLSTPEALVDNWSWIIDNGVFMDNQNPSYEFTAGMHNVSFQVEDTNGCVVSMDSVLDISPHQIPEALFTFELAEQNVFENEVSFMNQSVDANAYQWYFGDGHGTSITENPTYIFEDGYPQYTITLWAHDSITGCYDSTSKVLSINRNLLIYVPNAFTPDGDEVNDMFLPKSNRSIDEFHLLIYNRWGELLFESNEITNGWDGTYQNDPMPDDVYVWKIIYKELDSAKMVELSGHVTLLK